MFASLLWRSPCDPAPVPVVVAEPDPGPPTSGDPTALLHYTLTQMRAMQVVV